MAECQELGVVGSLVLELRCLLPVRLLFGQLCRSLKEFRRVLSLERTQISRRGDDEIEQAVYTRVRFPALTFSRHELAYFCGQSHGQT